MQLENKVAVVTGASSGKAIAFAKEGAAVVADYRGPPEETQDVVGHGEAAL